MEQDEFDEEEGGYSEEVYQLPNSEKKETPKSKAPLPPVIKNQSASGRSKGLLNLFKNDSKMKAKPAELPTLKFSSEPVQQLYQQKQQVQQEKLSFLPQQVLKKEAKPLIQIEENTTKKQAPVKSMQFGKGKSVNRKVSKKEIFPENDDEADLDEGSLFGDFNEAKQEIVQINASINLINVYESIKPKNYFPLEDFSNFLNSLEVKDYKSISFNGMESVTDMVFYVMKKITKKNKTIYLYINTVNLDSCRYVTDFGIQLLKDAIGKNDIIKIENLNGCVRLCRSLYSDLDEKNDLFLSKKFTKCFDKTVLKSYKILIINDTDINMINYLRSGSVVKHESDKFFYGYENIDMIYKKEVVTRGKKADTVNVVNKEYRLNAIEVYKDCPSMFYTEDSILQLCVYYEADKLIENLTTKLLHALNSNIHYVSIIVVIITDVNNFKVHDIIASLEENLKKTVQLLNSEEEKIPSLIDKMDFQQQEKYRDILRLKYSIEKFLENIKTLSYFKIVQLSEANMKDDETLKERLLYDLYDRIQSTYYEELNKFLYIQRYDQSVVKFEDFIDDIYSYESFEFKKLMRTNAELKNLALDYLKFKSFLGECIHFKNSSGQTLIVFDFKWLFTIITKIRSQFNGELLTDKHSDFSYISYDQIKTKLKDDVLDDEQFGYLLDVLHEFKEIIKFEDRYILSKKLGSSNTKFELVWPNSSNNFFICLSKYEFYCPISINIFLEIQSLFSHLPVKFINNSKIVYQEGCISTFVELSEAKTQISISSGLVNLPGLKIKQDVDENLKNILMCMFNEYRIMLENVLLKTEIAYKTSSENISGFKLHKKIYTNFDGLSTNDYVDNPKDYFVGEHTFSLANKCEQCSINSEYFKLAHKSYRSVYPFMKSEIEIERWSSTPKTGLVEYTLSEPSQTPVTFAVQNQSTLFFGKEKLNPYSYNTFKATFKSVTKAENVKIGILIQKTEERDTQILFLDARSRRIYKMKEQLALTGTNYSRTKLNKNELVENQRYIREYNSKTKLVKLLFDDKAEITLAAKNAKEKVVNEIKSRSNNSKDENRNADRLFKQPDFDQLTESEIWTVKNGDEISIQVIEKGNGLQFEFFYNDEKIGFWLLKDISNLNDYSIRPHCEIDANLEVFFDISSQPIKSYVASNYEYQKGMYLEAEYESYPGILSPSFISDINQETGQLCIQLAEINAKFWSDPFSPTLHPCGYWEYIQKEMYDTTLEKPKKYKNIERFEPPPGFNKPTFQSKGGKSRSKSFNWSSYLTDKPDRIPVPSSFFIEDQHGGMCAKETYINNYFPKFEKAENKLTCSFLYNPRNIWNAMKKLTQDDLTEIFSKLGCFKILNDEVQKKEILTALPALALLPPTIDENFINCSNLNYFHNSEINLQVSCIHREQVKLENQSETDNSLVICLPHLIHDTGLQLNEKTKLTDYNYLYMILITCLDMARSNRGPLSPNLASKYQGKFEQEQINQTLRSYFEQISSLLIIMAPFRIVLKSRFNKILLLKQLLPEEFLTFNNTEPTEQKPNDIDKFIKEKINEYFINNAGSCKYCNSLDINFATNQTDKSADSVVGDIMSKNNEYNSVITKLSLVDFVQLNENQNSSIKRTISLNKEMLAQLSNLQNIVIEGLKVNKIDENLKECKNLESIELINNDLTEFPEAVSFVETLKQVIIENNPIKEIPKKLFQIKTLKSIVLNKLSIKSLPDNWAIEGDQKSQLKSLVLRETRLNSLPSDLLRNNVHIEELMFDGVHLLLPETQQNWPNLLINMDALINLYCPVLLSVNETIELFKKYDYDKNMVLNYVEIQHLNAELFQKYPRLGDNLTSVDSDLLGGLPVSLFQLSSLTCLDLSFQAIRRIPDAIEALKNLKSLKLKYCIYLEILSSMLSSLPVLSELDIVGCINLKTPPLEIQRRGFASIIAYLKRLRSGSVTCKRTKLMLVGHGASGKTSLINCLLDSMYGNSGQPPPDLTDGIHIRSWPVPLSDDSASNLSFSVWDFAGQQVYYNTHQFFLTNRSVYLLLWNCRLGVEHGALEFWLNSITCHAPGCPIFIVGTHIDQVSKYDLPIEFLKKRFPSIVGAYFVSCFDGKNIDTLAQDIIKKTLEEKYMGEKIPECWLQFEDLLAQLKLEKSLIAFEEIEKIGMTCGIFDKSELAQTIQFLHDLGSLLHFNNEFLKHNVIINPQYIVDMMASLVSVNQLCVDDGKMYHKDIPVIWKNYDPSLHEWIVKLTERFDLTFSLPESNMHLVPCLMPDTPPNSFSWPNIEKEQQSSKLKKEIIIFYHFDYLPAGLFNRLQVRLYQLSDNNVIWKNGSVLKKNNHLTLVQRLNNRIEIKVQGVHPENVLFSIHEVLEVLINESFNGVRYDFSFPCPDCIDNNAIDIEKSMFSSSLVRRAFEMKAAFLQCRQYFHPVSLVDLNARFPPDTVSSFDIQFRYSIRDLKHFKKYLKNDIAIIYSSQDTENDNTIQPRKLKSDLETHSYQCWFSETPSSIPFDSLILALKSSTLVLFCMSDNFVRDDYCVKAFNYVKRILRKPYLLAVIAEGSEWQKSEIGALIAHEVYVKINTAERYKTRLPELLEQVQKRLNENDKKRKEKNNTQCFISYCHANSHDAVNKGAPLRNDFCLGKYDPRSIKEHLDKNGYTSWLDVDQVGGKGTLFEDIVEGIRNAKIVIACVSNEYAESENCMKEFRFSTNLKKPIIICLFGSSKAYANWRGTELGMISCLNNKEINFQIENPDAFNDLLDELKKLKIYPEKKAESEIKNQLFGESEESLNSDQEIIYSELSELAQRRFLRQVAGYSSDYSKPLPRLFVLDIDKSTNQFLKDSSAAESNSQNVSATRQTRLLTKAGSIDIQNNRYCIKALCEHERGWHPSGQSLDYDQKDADFHYAYFVRMMTLVKHIKMLDLNILDYEDILDEYLVKAQEKLELSKDPLKNIIRSRTIPLVVTELHESFGLLSVYIQKLLDNIKSKKPNSEDNPNNIEAFDLCRCILPSGKILWLCPEHRKDENIQVLTTDFGANQMILQNDEFNSILLEKLKNAVN